LPDGSYRFVALGDSPLVLGRDEGADLQLPFSDVSRRHAEISKDGPIFVVRDLGSRNGVHLNGEPCLEGPLSVGDLLRVGECLGIVGAGSPASPGASDDGLLIGPVMAVVLTPLRAAARSDLPIVLAGETGTGKEEVAKFIHAQSGRGGTFLGLNCAALPEALAEAELFGFQRGAFTGADRARPGHFREADGGTLLLDEISDLSLPLQAKLLRVLEEREVLSLGASVPVPIDVRIVAATQEPLERAVASKRFRADLLARLRGLTVVLPPLRHRREEIPFLFRAFLQRYAPGKPISVSARLLEQLCRHDWPFNVRELALLAKRLVTLHGHETTLTRAHLPPDVLTRGSEDAPTGGETPEPRRARKDEREELVAALRTCEGNLSRAADQIGISRGKAYRLLEAVDLDLRSLRNAL
jgi:transcriptional regulator with PAS, ATPase and Fis domain